MGGPEPAAVDNTRKHTLATSKFDGMRMGCCLSGMLDSRPFTQAVTCTSAQAWVVSLDSCSGRIARRNTKCALMAKSTSRQGRGSARLV
jgi:hypothetical protein